MSFEYSEITNLNTNNVTSAGSLIISPNGVKGLDGQSLMSTNTGAAVWGFPLLSTNESKLKSIEDKIKILDDRILALENSDMVIIPKKK